MQCLRICLIWSRRADSSYRIPLSSAKKIQNSLPESIGGSDVFQKNAVIPLSLSSLSAWIWLSESVNRSLIGARHGGEEGEEKKERGTHTCWASDKFEIISSRSWAFGQRAGRAPLSWCLAWTWRALDGLADVPPRPVAFLLFESFQGRNPRSGRCGSDRAKAIVHIHRD